MISKGETSGGGRVGPPSMRPGDKVRLSMNSRSWCQGDVDREYVFICECGGNVLICPAATARPVHISEIFPVVRCKECGQELLEK